MFAIDFLQWWYKKGWSVFSRDFKTKLRDTADTFSIGDLLATLFKPYRQISANSDSREAGGIVNVVLDKLVSRLVGMLTRLVLIIAGVVALLLELVIGGAVLVIWPLMPLLPIAGVVLAIIGVKF